MDLRQLKNLMKEFEESNIHKLEINDKEFSIKLEKESKQYVNAAPAQVSVPVMSTEPVNASEVKEIIEENNNVLVKAPLVGTFYDAPSPDSETFCSLNQYVNKGDVLFIVEAMKVMNEITAPVSGTIVKINVNDATMVEFGQVVMEIQE
jgi:acetyl-CoA carboxylase biotin carboxyl carrier protein